MIPTLASRRIARADIRRGLFGWLLSALCAGPFIPQAGAADSDFLKGATVRLVVGFSPGGGYDAYARMLAPRFEQATGATVIVENRPGGGGAVALNQLVRARPDGLTIMLANGEGALMAQLMRQPAVAYDLRSFAKLARVTDEPHLLLLGSHLPADLRAVVASGKPLKFSAMSRLDNLGDYATILCAALRHDCRIVTGYAGSKEAGLAVMNGEVDALAVSDMSASVYAESGRAHVVVAISHQRSALRPDVPTIFELFTFTPGERRWLDFRLGIKAVGRVLLAPPGLAPERRQRLEEAWRKVLTDPALIAEAQRARRPLHYEEPAQLEHTVRDLLDGLSPTQREELESLLLHRYP